MSTVSRRVLPVAALTLLPTFLGCLPRNQTEVRQNAQRDFAEIRATSATGTNGRVIAPRRNSLKTAILKRDEKDPAINEKLWASADEQFLPADTLRLLKANGLRVGVLSGGLPVETEAAMKQPPPNQVDPVMIDLPDGDPTEVSLATSKEPVTLLITREGRTEGKDYEDAKGMLRIVAHQNGSGGITLKIVPEIHHGPIRKEITATPNTTGYNPQEFMFKTGQEVDHFRDLTASVTLKPGQVAVIGGRSAEASRNLGSYLFREIEEKNDQAKEKILLIWATPYGGMGLATSGASDVMPSSVPSHHAK